MRLTLALVLGASALTVSGVALALGVEFALIVAGGLMFGLAALSLPTGGSE